MANQRFISGQDVPTLVFGDQGLDSLEMDDPAELYHEASPMTYLNKQTAPTLFLRGGLDNPEADIGAMEKLKSLGVDSQRLILPDAKHGCWMQQPWFAQCIDAVDVFFKKQLK